MTRAIRLVCDIGGTHIRIAVVEGGALVAPEKFPVSDFATPESALLHYLDQHNRPAVPCRVAICCAANDDGAGVYRFTNNPGWTITPSLMKAAGWEIDRVTHDFYASAWGVTVIGSGGVDPVRPGRPDAVMPRAILGPGTGLGLAYIFPLRRDQPGGGYHVQMTHGGHMLSLVLSDEHFLIVELIRRIKGDAYTIIPENMCSGRGLPFLYQAVCNAYGYDRVYEMPREMLDHPGDPAVRETLRLFHEFLGLFAHQAVLTGNAFGGLYLDGGVLHHLRERNLFDKKTFIDFMTLNPVPVVRASLDRCPVYLVTDPFIALRGLLAMDASVMEKKDGQ